MWWPFAKRGTRLDATPRRNVSPALPDDLSAFARNDACIKVWLPDRLISALDSLSAAHAMSRPDVLRWLLFEHVFGRPALERLRQWKAARQANRDGSEPAFAPSQPSERHITAQLLGKSVEDFKLWLPRPLRDELAHLAVAECLGLSDYIRKTLVRVLLGEAFHHRWRAAVGKLAAEVRRFEEGQTLV